MEQAIKTLLPGPTAVTVRQCQVCKKILSWPILNWAEADRLAYLHCGVGTLFIEIRARERQSVCCEGDAG